MLIEDIEQGSERWHKWRTDKGTASNAACVMGESEWTPKTWYELFRSKKGLLPIEETDAMRFGTDNEPIARNRYQELYEFRCDPVLVSKTFHHDQNGIVVDPYKLGCSLDGYDSENQEHNLPLEIKCPFRGTKSKLWQTLKDTGDIVDNDELLPQYYWQAQHIMLVTGAAAMHFFVWTSESSLLRTVLADEWQQGRLKEKWREFLEYLHSDTSPPLTPEDKVHRDDLEWIDLATQWLQHDDVIKSAKQKQEPVRGRLIELAGEQSSFGSGVRVNINHDAMTATVPDEVKDRYRRKADKPSIRVERFQEKN